LFDDDAVLLRGERDLLFTGDLDLVRLELVTPFLRSGVLRLGGGERLLSRSGDLRLGGERRLSLETDLLRSSRRLELDRRLVSKSFCSRSF